MLTPAEFYKDEAVRARIQEYCGDAQYLVGYGEGLSAEGFLSMERDRFDWILARGLDIFRSIWDRSSTLGLLDVEYFNIDYPGEILFKPREAYAKLEPFYKTALKVFYQFGIRPLVLVTGQGYHFSTRLPRGSAVHKEMESLGRLSPTLLAKYASVSARRREPVPRELGLAYEGMGRLMEYLSHRILRLARRLNGLPVVLTDVAVGRRDAAGREAISVDLSQYGDPLYMRDIRCPFSSYQKHKVQRYKYGERAAREIPAMVTLVREEPAVLADLLSIRRHLRNAAHAARGCKTEIPESEGGFGSLIASYKRSALFQFHKEFDACEHDPPQKWPDTYDAMDINRLPPCVRLALSKPNDNILKPTNLQILSRVLTKMGWHAKHIAGLVRSKLERDFGWGNTWLRYDAASRADFYVRMFAGMLATGLDGEEDLNCVSHQEKGYCVQPNCGFNLADYRLKK